MWNVRGSLKAKDIVPFKWGSTKARLPRPPHASRECPLSARVLRAPQIGILRDRRSLMQIDAALRQAGVPRGPTSRMAATAGPQLPLQSVAAAIVNLCPNNAQGPPWRGNSALERPIKAYSRQR